MKKWAFVLGMILLPTFVWAGFQGYNGTSSLGVFNQVRCSTGMSCTNVNGKFTMVSSAAAGDISGAEGADAELTLNADEGDDNGDSWLIEALASGNSLSFKNDTSGSQVEKLAISTAGVLAFSDSETLTNASDVITLTFDDAAANLKLNAFEATDAKFVLQADQSDDNGDDWQFISIASGNTFAIQNDASGSFVSKVVISASAGDVTGPGTGSISGFIQKQVASSAATLSVTQCGSTIVTAGAHTMVLPEASTVLGCRYVFVGGTADTLTIDPADGTDVIGPINFVAAGSAGAIGPAAGDAVSFTDIGASLVLEACGADLWCPVGVANMTITDAD